MTTWRRPCPGVPYSGPSRAAGMPKPHWLQGAPWDCCFRHPRPHGLERRRCPCRERGGGVGFSIGTDACVAAEGQRAAEKEQALLDGLLELDGPQAALLLLLYCEAPRASCLLRTTPLWQLRAYAEGLDTRALAASTTRRLSTVDTLERNAPTGLNAASRRLKATSDGTDE